MSKILEDLYNGLIDPAEHHSDRISEYEAILKEQSTHYNDFIKKLDPSLAQEFMNIMDEQINTVPFELSEAFTDGFRLGAKMMIEVFNDKKSYPPT